jgi:hypothetical protein
MYKDIVEILNKNKTDDPLTIVDYLSYELEPKEKETNNEVDIPDNIRKLLNKHSLWLLNNHEELIFFIRFNYFDLYIELRPLIACKRYPNKVFDMYPELMLEHHKQWVLDNRKFWVMNNHPELMFEYRPDELLDHNLIWLMENKLDWLKENYPDLYNDFILNRNKLISLLEEKESTK